MSFLTVEEVAAVLKVEPKNILSLIEDGKLRAVRIGEHVRIRESELEELETRCPASDCYIPDEPKPPLPIKPRTSQKWRVTQTINGKEFRVSGSLAEGFQIWPGKMHSPIRFTVDFLPALLSRFAGQEIPVGGQFDNAEDGSLGKFIQDQVGTKMNPAVYVRALLIEEGYAVEGSRRGYIRLLSPSV